MVLRELKFKFARKKFVCGYKLPYLCAHKMKCIMAKKKQEKIFVPIVNADDSKKTETFKFRASPKTISLIDQMQVYFQTYFEQNFSMTDVIEEALSQLHKKLKREEKRNINLF